MTEFWPLFWRFRLQGLGCYSHLYCWLRWSYLKHFSRYYWFYWLYLVCCFHLYCLFHLSYLRYYFRGTTGFAGCVGVSLSLVLLVSLVVLGRFRWYYCFHLSCLRSLSLVLLLSLVMLGVRFPVLLLSLVVLEVAFACTTALTCHAWRVAFAVLLVSLVVLEVSLSLVLLVVSVDFSTNRSNAVLWFVLIG